MKKFTESISNDIFDDVEKLKFLLTEFKDYGLIYTINYHLQKYDQDMNNLFAIRTSNKGFDDLGMEKDIKDYVMCYIVKFAETYEILTSDQQRVGRAYGIPTNKTYGFMEVAQDVQHKVEGLGHTFALAMRDSEFDIMILKGKHK